MIYNRILWNEMFNMREVLQQTSRSNAFTASYKMIYIAYKVIAAMCIYICSYIQNCPSTYQK